MLVQSPPKELFTIEKEYTGKKYSTKLSYIHTHKKLNNKKNAPQNQTPHS